MNFPDFPYLLPTSLNFLEFPECGLLERRPLSRTVSTVQCITLGGDTVHRGDLRGAALRQAVPQLHGHLHVRHVRRVVPLDRRPRADTLVGARGWHHQPAYEDHQTRLARAGTPGRSPLPRLRPEQGVRGAVQTRRVQPHQASVLINQIYHLLTSPFICYLYLLSLPAFEITIVRCANSQGPCGCEGHDWCARCDCRLPCAGILSDPHTRTLVSVYQLTCI